MRTLVLAAALLVSANAAHAVEIEALISTAVKTAMDELLPSFQRATGNTIKVSYDPSGGVVRRYVNGEAADVVIVDSAAIDDLIKQGKLVAGRIDIARTGIGIAIKKGAPKPDVSSAEALKRALLAAKTVGHTAPAGGGITALHIQRMFVKLGIDKQLEGRIKLAKGGPNGRVSVLVSSGEAEIGLQQVSELMSNPDVEVIGLLPTELQQITIYSGGVTATAKQPDAAKALLQHLAAPAAAAVYKPKGLGL